MPTDAEYDKAQELLKTANLTRANPEERPAKVQSCSRVANHLMQRAINGATSSEFVRELCWVLKLLLRASRDTDSAVAHAAEEKLTFLVRQFSPLYPNRTRQTLLYGLAKYRAACTLRLLPHVLRYTLPGAMPEFLGALADGIAKLLQTRLPEAVAAYAAASAALYAAVAPELASAPFDLLWAEHLPLLAEGADAPRRHAAAGLAQLLLRSARPRLLNAVRWLAGCLGDGPADEVPKTPATKGCLYTLREMCVVGRALGTGPCALRCPEVAAAFGELVLGRGEALLALPDLEDAVAVSTVELLNSYMELLAGADGEGPRSPEVAGVLVPAWTSDRWRRHSAAVLDLLARLTAPPAWRVPALAGAVTYLGHLAARFPEILWLALQDKARASTKTGWATLQELYTHGDATVRGPALAFTCRLVGAVVMEGRPAPLQSVNLAAMLHGVMEVKARYLGPPPVLDPGPRGPPASTPRHTETSVGCAFTQKWVLSGLAGVVRVALRRPAVAPEVLQRLPVILHYCLDHHADPLNPINKFWAVKCELLGLLEACDFTALHPVEVALGLPSVQPRAVMVLLEAVEDADPRVRASATAALVASLPRMVDVQFGPPPPSETGLLRTLENEADAALLAGAKAGHRLPAGPTRLSVLGGPRLPACTAAALRWPDCDDAVTDQEQLNVQRLLAHVLGTLQRLARFLYPAGTAPCADAGGAAPLPKPSLLGCLALLRAVGLRYQSATDGGPLAACARPLVAACIHLLHHCPGAADLSVLLGLLHAIEPLAPHCAPGVLEPLLPTVIFLLTMTVQVHVQGPLLSNAEAESRGGGGWWDGWWGGAATRGTVDPESAAAQRTVDLVFGLLAAGPPVAVDAAFRDQALRMCEALYAAHRMSRANLPGRGRPLLFDDVVTAALTTITAVIQLPALRPAVCTLSNRLLPLLGEAQALDPERALQAAGALFLASLGGRTTGPPAAAGNDSPDDPRPRLRLPASHWELLTTPQGLEDIHDPPTASPPRSPTGAAAAAAAAPALAPLLDRLQHAVQCAGRCQWPALQAAAADVMGRLLRRGVPVYRLDREGHFLHALRRQLEGAPDSPTVAMLHPQFVQSATHLLFHTLPAIPPPRSGQVATTNKAEAARQTDPRAAFHHLLAVWHDWASEDCLLAAGRLLRSVNDFTLASRLLHVAPHRLAARCATHVLSAAPDRAGDTLAWLVAEVFAGRVEVAGDSARSDLVAVQAALIKYTACTPVAAVEETLGAVATRALEQLDTDPALPLLARLLATLLLLQFAQLGLLASDTDPLAPWVAPTMAAALRLLPDTAEWPALRAGALWWIVASSLRSIHACLAREGFAVCLPALAEPLGALLATLTGFPAPSPAEPDRPPETTSAPPPVVVQWGVAIGVALCRRWGWPPGTFAAAWGARLGVAGGAVPDDVVTADVLFAGLVRLLQCGGHAERGDGASGAPGDCAVGVLQWWRHPELWALTFAHRDASAVRATLCPALRRAAVSDPALAAALAQFLEAQLEALYGAAAIRARPPSPPVPPSTKPATGSVVPSDGDRAAEATPRHAPPERRSSGSATGSASPAAASGPPWPGPPPRGLLPGLWAVLAFAQRWPCGAAAVRAVLAEFVPRAISAADRKLLTTTIVAINGGQQMVSTSPRPSTPVDPDEPSSSASSSPSLSEPLTLEDCVLKYTTQGSSGLQRPGCVLAALPPASLQRVLTAPGFDVRLLPALVCTRPAGGQREVLWGYLLGRLEAVTEGQGPLAEWVLLLQCTTGLLRTSDGAPGDSPLPSAPRTLLGAFNALMAAVAGSKSTFLHTATPSTVVYCLATLCDYASVILQFLLPGGAPAPKQDSPGELLLPWRTFLRGVACLYLFVHTSVSTLRAPWHAERHLLQQLWGRPLKWAVHSCLHLLQRSLAPRRPPQRLVSAASPGPAAPAVEALAWRIAATYPAVLHAKLPPLLDLDVLDLDALRQTVQVVHRLGVRAALYPRYLQVFQQHLKPPATPPAPDPSAPRPDVHGSAPVLLAHLAVAVLLSCSPTTSGPPDPKAPPHASPLARHGFPPATFLTQPADTVAAVRGEAPPPPEVCAVRPLVRQIADYVALCRTPTPSFAGQHDGCASPTEVSEAEYSSLLGCLLAFVESVLRGAATVPPELVPAALAPLCVLLQRRPADVAAHAAPEQLLRMVVLVQQLPIDQEAVCEPPRPSLSLAMDSTDFIALPYGYCFASFVLAALPAHHLGGSVARRCQVALNTTLEVVLRGSAFALAGWPLSVALAVAAGHTATVDRLLPALAAALGRLEDPSLSRGGLWHLLGGALWGATAVQAGAAHRLELGPFAGKAWDLTLALLAGPGVPQRLRWAAAHGAYELQLQFRLSHAQRQRIAQSLAELTPPPRPRVAWWRRPGEGCQPAEGSPEGPSPLAELLLLGLQAVYMATDGSLAALTECQARQQFLPQPVADAVQANTMAAVRAVHRLPGPWSRAQEAAVPLVVQLAAFFLEDDEGLALLLGTFLHPNSPPALLTVVFRMMQGAQLSSRWLAACAPAVVRKEPLPAAVGALALLLLAASPAPGAGGWLLELAAAGPPCPAEAAELAPDTSAALSGLPLCQRCSRSLLLHIPSPGPLATVTRTVLVDPAVAAAPACRSALTAALGVLADRAAGTAFRPVVDGWRDHLAAQTAG